MTDKYVLYVECRYCGGTGTAGGGINPDGDCPQCKGDKELYVGEVRWQDSVGKKLIHTYEISENTDPDEYNALSDAFKQVYRDITGMGVVDLAGGTVIRATLWLMFDENSTTRADLLTLLGE